MVSGLLTKDWEWLAQPHHHRLAHQEVLRLLVARLNDRRQSTALAIHLNVVLFELEMK